MIEARFDIAFEDPLSTVLSGKDRKTLLNGICWGSFLAESIGIGVTDHFCNGVQSQQVQSLHGSVLHARQTRSTLPHHLPEFQDG